VNNSYCSGFPFVFVIKLIVVVVVSV